MWLGGDDFGLTGFALFVVAEGSLFCYLSRHRYGGVRMGYINQKERGEWGRDSDPQGYGKRGLYSSGLSLLRSPKEILAWASVQTLARVSGGILARTLFGPLARVSFGVHHGFISVR